MKIKFRMSLGICVFAFTFLFFQTSQAHAGTLSNVSYSAGSYDYGATTDYTLSYTTQTLIQASGDMVLRLLGPGGITIPGGNSFPDTEISVNVTINGQAKIPSEVWGGNYGYIRMGEEIAAGSQVVIVIHNVHNSSEGGSFNWTGTFFTADSGANSLDVTGNLQPLVIVGPPTVVSAGFTGDNQITIVYSEPVTGQVSDYSSFKIGSSDYRNITSLSGDGTNTVVLTFDGAAAGPDATGVIDINSPPNSVKSVSTGIDLAATRGLVVSDWRVHAPNINSTDFYQEEIYFSWDSQAGVDHYDVEYKKTSDAQWEQTLSAGDGGSNWVNFYNLTPSTSYDFRVLATDQNEQVFYSDIVTGSTLDIGSEAVDFFGAGQYNEEADWTNGNNDNTNTSFSNPSGVAIDNNHHRMFVADGGGDGQRNNRIMEFDLNNDNTPKDHIADAIIYSVNVNGSESNLNAPRNVFYDNVHDRLFIGDSNNGRVVVIDTSDDFVTDNNTDDPKTVPVAQNVLGAGDFDYPLGMTLDNDGGRLFVAEKNKSKGSTYGSINVFDVRPSGSPAQSMCGVSRTGIANVTPSCTLWIDGAYGPRDVAYDGNSQMLYVAYADQNRVLALDVRNEGSDDKTMCGVATNGLPADDTDAVQPSCVLGQSNLDDTDSDTSRNGLNVPRGLWYDSTEDRLFVADLGNSRILQFNEMSSMENGMDASAVFGQAEFDQDYSNTNRHSLDNPNAVTVDPVNARLYVSDNDNSRIMVFNLNENSENPGEPINVGPTAEKFQADIESGFISVAGNNPLATAAVTFEEEYTIIIGDENNPEAKVVLPAGTVMTKTGGGAMDFTTMDFEDVTAALKGANTSNIAGAVSLGIPGLNLSFSPAITITINVGSSYNGQTLNVYFQNNGQSDWTGGLSCTVANGLCTFQTDHATKYSAGDEPGGTIKEDAQKAHISSWEASQYTDDSKCEVKLKLEIKGKHFAKNAEVKLGKKEASSVKRKNSKNITATFCMTKLMNDQTDHKKILKVTNPDADTEKADKKINLMEVGYKLNIEDFNTQTAEGIKNIQQALSQLGYLNVLYITGNYGSITTEAVKKFQGDNGIEQSGNFGPLTKAKLAEKVK